MIELPLEKLRNLLNCPSLQVYTDLTWGSSQAEYRPRMASFISETIQAPLRHSLSHCRDCGIIAASTTHIGVDIEEVERVNEKVITRMSTASEIQNAPDYASLWAAKEASFKALMNYRQPMVISRLEIGGWHKIDSQTETFCLLNNDEFVAPVGHGVTIRSSSRVISIFVFPT